MENNIRELTWIAQCLISPLGPHILLKFLPGMGWGLGTQTWAWSWLCELPHSTFALGDSRDLAGIRRHSPAGPTTYHHPPLPSNLVGTPVIQGSV